MKRVLKSVEAKMEKAVEHLRHELATLRTGRASVHLLDSVRVDSYGAKVPLNQVANLTVPDAQLILISPWDPKTIPAIERAIQEANVGLNPASDGKVIRLPVPPLTEERRKEMCKRAREMAEQAKVAVRQARHEGRDRLSAMEKSKELSEDERNRGWDEVQKLHDRFVSAIDEALKTRETDIMSV